MSPTHFFSQPAALFLRGPKYPLWLVVFYALKKYSAGYYWTLEILQWERGDNITHLVSTTFLGTRDRLSPQC